MERKTTNNQRGAWMNIPILTPQQFFTEMEKKYLFSGFNPDGCSREEIHEAIITGEHELFSKDPNSSVLLVDAMGLDGVEDKNELLAEWYWQDKVESDYRRDYELLE
jgi:hypothetical protein